MKIRIFLNDFILLKLIFVILSLLFIPLFVDAGTFYHCLDDRGNETLLDSPIDGQKCTPMQTYEETKVLKKETKTTVSSEDRITKITVKGNQILVPVTLINGNTEETVTLLLDTGAQGTLIHNEVADRLYINLGKARKIKAEVVGGTSLDASIINIDTIKIGPHTLHNKNIAVVPYEGRAARFDGLLGMDFLGRFGYRIDLAKQIIIWE
jgi:predicted aspartyl protease